MSIYETRLYQRFNAALYRYDLDWWCNFHRYRYRALRLMKGRADR